MTVRALINVPAKARRGEIIEIKTLIAHPMETGFRVGLNGALIPRDIITTFRCTYNGEEIFRADFSPAIRMLSPLPIRQSALAGTPGRSTAISMESSVS